MSNTVFKKIAKFILPPLLWCIALLLFAEVYVPQTVYSNEWYVLIIIFILFLVGSLVANPSPSAIYMTLAFMMALFVWSTPNEQTVFEEVSPQDVTVSTEHTEWLEIYGWLFATVAIYTLSKTKHGNAFFNHWSLKVGGVLLLSVSLIGVFGEAFIRTEYSRYYVLGPYPRNTIPEYTEERQQWGAADMPFSLERSEDKLRVLVIGDSYTYGDAVFTKDRYADQLQIYDTENLEVVVLAQNGASTKDQLAWWSEFGEPVQADVVIVGVVTNDPDVGRIQQRSLITSPLFANHFSRSQFAYYLDVKNVFPVLRDISETRDGLSYGDWESQLYGTENLSIWQNTYVEPLYQAIVDSGADAWAYIFSPHLGETADTYNGHIN